MEVLGLPSSEKIGFVSSWWLYLCMIPDKIYAGVVGLFTKLKKIALDDPRRVFHSMKVGLALTLISIFYDINPLFNSFGISAMWAVLTVVVVMEYTVGGTLNKGLNRIFATLLAGALGLGAHQIAVLCGEKGEPIVLGVMVFLLASAATFSRFIPSIKARYDYGVTIFILTFSLVAVSSYRVDEIIQLAQQRLSTIAIGVATCLCTTMFVCPVWAGQDLHDMASTNLERLASFLQGLGEEYFGEKTETDQSILEGKHSFLQCHKGVLNSKPTEESMANLARCEPGHGRFGFRHPWKQYLKIGSLARECAYSMEALTAHLTTPGKPAPASASDLLEIRTAWAEMSSESAKALSELATAIRAMAAPSAAVGYHMASASAAAEKLRAELLLRSAVSSVLHVAATSAIMIDIVRSSERIVEAVGELARLACFKSVDGVHRATVKPVGDGDGDGPSSHVVITVVD